MKKIPKRNYLYVVLILIVTIILTFILSNIYISKNKFVSDFYEYSNKIKSDELFEFILENPESIIYISDKYDLSYSKFEKKLKNKIETLNIKNKFVYIDKLELNKSFINQVKENYNVKLNYKNNPIILFVVDKNIIKIQEIKNDTDIHTLINYEVFE